MPARGRSPITRETRRRGDRLRVELKRAREKKDWRQQDLATQIGMSMSTLISIETGKSADPGFLNVRDIAEALGISPSRLFQITR